MDSTAAPALILVVDDEPDLVRGVRLALTASGYAVQVAADGPTAIRACVERPPDLVVLDLMLPGMDGLEVCRVLRRDSQVPLLILTARADDVDRILGLELGADDYLTKPFHMRELLARIRAILRRAQPQGPAVPAAIALDGGRVHLDMAGQRVLVAGREVQLTRTEFSLLAHLARHPGRVFGRAELLEQVWGYEYSGDTRTVDAHVRRLRHKIEKDPAAPQLIRTRFGVGYLLAPPD